MAFGLFVAVLLGLAAERVISEQRHFITWDRHWLNDNLTDFTLNVELNDRVTFICQVNDSEYPEDRAENIINLLEEQDLNDCNARTGNITIITECVQPGDHDININDALELANRQTFEAGGVYYFTSFSDGTVESALSDPTSGGGCTLSPPLKLTISISATDIIVPSSTIPVIATNPTGSSSAMDIIMTTTEMSTSKSSATTQTTNIVSTSTPPPTSAQQAGGAGLLSPLYSVVLLVLLLTFIVIL